MEKDRVAKAHDLHDEYLEIDGVLAAVEKGDDPAEPWTIKTGRSARRFFGARLKTAIYEAIKKTMDDIEAEIEAL